MPKLNFQLPIVDLVNGGHMLHPTKNKDGSQIMPGTPDYDKRDAADLTIRDVVVNTLLSQTPQENPDISEKEKRYKLAEKCAAEGLTDLSLTEINVIRDLCVKLTIPYVTPILRSLEAEVSVQ